MSQQLTETKDRADAAKAKTDQALEVMGNFDAELRQGLQLLQRERDADLATFNLLRRDRDYLDDLRRKAHGIKNHVQVFYVGDSFGSDGSGAGGPAGGARVVSSGEVSAPSGPGGSSGSTESSGAGPGTAGLTGADGGPPSIDDVIAHLTGNTHASLAASMAAGSMMPVGGSSGMSPRGVGMVVDPGQRGFLGVNNVHVNVPERVDALQFLDARYRSDTSVNNVVKVDEAWYIH